MSKYSSVSIIYNPKSTGLSKKLAEELSYKLQKTISAHQIDLIPTKSAGHAETLAYDLAMKSKTSLIISASGDGGYNEVINGLMKAQAKGAKPVAGLLPAGNANDHYRNLHDSDTYSKILAAKVRDIDLLELNVQGETKSSKRYAHSYIGFGLTPLAGNELNKTKLNVFKEVWIVCKVLYGLKPTTIEVAGKRTSFDSIIFSNIASMSKMLKVAKQAKADDGIFEVIKFPVNSRVKLLKSLLRASTIGIKNPEKARVYNFITTEKTLSQLDGEIYPIAGGRKVTISICHKALKCIV